MTTVAATGLAVALACGSAVEPETVLGTWYLHAYNDSAMPGEAEFRSGSGGSVIAIDSVRLSLDADASCGWLVHLANEAPNLATSCVWAVNDGSDDLVVTIDAAFVLRGDVLAALLRLQDPNGNVLEFERDPAVRGPVDPDPR